MVRLLYILVLVFSRHGLGTARVFTQGMDMDVSMVGQGFFPSTYTEPTNPPTGSSLDPAIAADGASTQGGWREAGETLLDVTVVVVPDRRERARLRCVCVGCVVCVWCGGAVCERDARVPLRGGFYSILQYYTPKHYSTLQYARWRWVGDGDDEDDTIRGEIIHARHSISPLIPVCRNQLPTI